MDESIEERKEELDRKMPKLKVCMASRNTGEYAQMLAQIQALPEGEMKASLLDSFMKTMMKTTQKSHDETSSGKELNNLKREVSDLKHKVQCLES